MGLMPPWGQQSPQVLLPAQKLWQGQFQLLPQASGQAVGVRLCPRALLRACKMER